MFRRHPLKWLFSFSDVGIFLWLQLRTVPVLPGEQLEMGSLHLSRAITGQPKVTFGESFASYRNNPWPVSNWHCCF